MDTPNSVTHSVDNPFAQRVRLLRLKLVGMLFVRAQSVNTLETLLRESFHIIQKHPLPLVLAGLVCFIGVALASNVLYLTLILNVYGRTGSYFGSSANILLIQWSVQGFFGFLLMSLGRGVVSWVALNAARAHISFKEAMRAAARNYPALLAGALLYGVFMSLAIVGFLYVLREIRMDVSNFRWLRNEGGAITSAMFVRGIAISLPDPGSPFTELYAYTRYSLSRSTNSIYFGWLGYSQSVSKVTLGIALVAVASAVFAWLVDTLLCLRHAVIMQKEWGSPRNVWGWLRDCITVGRQHFWHIIAVRTTLRLVLFLLTLVFVTLPITAHQGLFITELVRRLPSHNYLPYAFNQAFNGVGWALVNTTVVVLTLVFDAVLWRRLTKIN